MTFSMAQMAKAAKQASTQLAQLTTSEKNQALQVMAQELRKSHSPILEGNLLDLKHAKEANLSDAMVDRLTLTPERIEAIADALEAIVLLEDPVGKMSESSIRPNGLTVAKMRIPLGVIAMIYEARPNVTADAASLCLKSGNAVVLRGGREALQSSLAIAACLHKGLASVDIDPAAISVVPDPDRKHMNELLNLTEYVDLVIPRGGEGLIKFVSQNSKIPVIQHYKGVCHLYVDQYADIDKAVNILVNGKTQRPGVCNSLETLLVHNDIADAFFERANSELQRKEVRVHACSKSIGSLTGASLASDDDFHNEYLALELNVKVVDSINDAINHIHVYSSGHTEVIVSQDISRTQQFVKAVNSAVVMVNASSRFSDGGELGLGAEIGISTSKLHAYGPMGLESLTTQKFVVVGDGQIRS